LPWLRLNDVDDICRRHVALRLLMLALMMRLNIAGTGFKRF